MKTAICITLLCAAVAARSQDLTTIHNFALSAASEGSMPEGDLVLSGNTLFGTTFAGGLAGSGTVFKVNVDGAGFSVIHNFTTLYPGFGATANLGFNSDGGNPSGGLALAGNALYGMTLTGGRSGGGTVFRVNVDGTGFTNLYDFTNGMDGGGPSGNLIFVGGTLYGTTSRAGSNGVGTIFSLATNGAKIALIYTFSKTGTNGFNGDGASPRAGLVASNDFLYGTASAGGVAGRGTVFSFNTSTLAFTTIHSFTNGTDGAAPRAGLLLANDVLYGTASAGGTEEQGTVFSVNTSDSGFAAIYGFTGKNDGAKPEGDLLLAKGALYGTTAAGGTNGMGTVFGLNVSEGTLTNLYSFSAVNTNGNNGDGALPLAGLVLSNNMLYGVASSGGDGGNGSVFKEGVGGGAGSFAALKIFPANGDGGYEPIANLALSGITLYGNTERSAVGDGGGTIFAVNIDGSGFTTLFSFTETNQGVMPTSGMILNGNRLYGSTEFGGALGVATGYGGGAVYALDTDGADFMDFGILGTNAANPIGNLLLAGNTLYGTGSGALGPTSFGGVFKVQTDGTGFTLLHAFGDTNDGAYPLGGLVLSSGTLYGTTGGDGISTFGSVFSMSTNESTGLTNLYVFTNGVDGFSPFSTLVLSGGTLYGTTAFGATNGEGTVFTVNIDGTKFTNVYSFSGTDSNAFNKDGGFPYGGLILSAGTLYGTTAAAGPAGNGTIYKVNTDGTGFMALHAFSAVDATYSTNVDGGQPYCSLLLAGGALYGVTTTGGEYGGGTAFVLPVEGDLSIQQVGTNVVVTWSNPLFGLQSGPVAQGGYTNLVGVTSPHITPTTGAAQFFRLKALAKTGQ